MGGRNRLSEEMTFNLRTEWQARDNYRRVWKKNVPHKRNRQYNVLDLSVAGREK